MSDEKSDSGGMLATLTGGLSAAVKQRAVKAITTVVGAYFPDVLARAQAAKDDRDSRTAFRKALVDAAASKAVDDPALVSRMVDRLVYEEFGKQERRETIAIKTIEYLSDSQPDAPDEVDKDIDDDWLNLYNGFADRASSSSLQDMWARILSGQIRKPGSISLQTLQFVSVLDSETAQAASRVLPWLENKQHLLALNGSAEHYSINDRILLRDSGLIGSLVPDVISTKTANVDGVIFMIFPKAAVVLKGDPKFQFEFNCISVSRTCRELANIVPIGESTEPVSAMSDYAKTIPAVNEILIGPYSRFGNSVSQHPSTLTSKWIRPT